MDKERKNKEEGLVQKSHFTRGAFGGFTLIEVLVSVSIFAIVMVVATGAVFSIVEANKKAHSLKSVMTNLNFALESMMREIRVGRDYKCDGGSDCLAGGSRFEFLANRDVNGVGGYDSQDRIEYAFNSTCPSTSGAITKKIFGGANTSPIVLTANEIVIECMKFYVLGSAGQDDMQPKVVITIQGYAGVGETRSDFNIQTTVTQRAIDS